MAWLVQLSGNHISGAPLCHESCQKLTGPEQDYPVPSCLLISTGICRTVAGYPLSSALWQLGHHMKIVRMTMVRP